MKPEDINWVRKQFKNNKVWVAADANGQPMVEKNKVLIKYQLDQEHQYWVNLKAVGEVTANNTPRNPQKTTRAEGNRSDRKKKKAQDHLIDDPLNAIIIYTDGASSGNPGPSGIGVVMEYGGHEREISNYIGIATNNIAELTAVQTALMS
ncbi:MAG: RNase H family protein, partial [Desulfosalsimonadaceae bacterium]|nr:RNase H family protein [Desulfosalsimonadaceae bacterium]